VQGQHPVHGGAGREHEGGKLRGLFELAQLGAVAGHAQGDLWKPHPGQGGQQPEVVGMDDVGRKFPGGLCQRGLEGAQVALQHLFRESGKAGRWVGHDVAHAGNGEGHRGPLKADGNDLACGQRRDIRQRRLPGDADHRPLEVAGSGRVAHHGQQRNPAAGFPGLLGQQVQDPQGSLDGPAAGGCGRPEVEKLPRQSAGDRAWQGVRHGQRRNYLRFEILFNSSRDVESSQTSATA